MFCNILCRFPSTAMVEALLDHNNATVCLFFSHRTTMWWSFAQQRWTFRLEGSFMSPCGPRESSTCRVLPSKTKTWWGPSEWLWPKATPLTINSTRPDSSVHTVLHPRYFTIRRWHHKLKTSKLGQKKIKQTNWGTFILKPRRSLSS